MMDYRARVAHLANSGLRRFGVELASTAHSIEEHRRRILARATCALDVGANAGQWATAARNLGFEGRIESFEPGRDAFTALAANAALDPKWHPHPLALGAIRQRQRLFEADQSVNTSLLPPIDDKSSPTFLAGRWGEAIDVVPLDEIAPQLNLDGTTHLKIDTQGTELDVLAGAQASLRLVSTLEIELSLVPLYRGQALAEEVIAYARACGFEPVALVRGYTDPVTREVVQVDGFFRRHTAPGSGST